MRALCTEPELLLLDEITAALDPELVGEVLAIVRDLAAAGTTMVLATHEMAFARDVATRVCFLDAGRILEHGPPEQIFTDPREERTRQFLRRVLPALTTAPSSENAVTDSPGSRGRTAVTWLVTLLVLGFMVFMSVHRAMVEDEKPVHHSTGRSGPDSTTRRP